MNILFGPGRTWPTTEMSRRTIALDGACPEPLIDPEGERYSFDHHAACIRLITRATCEQVFDALLLGLDPDGYTILVNDLDGDTVLSVWLLRHHQRWRAPEDRDKVRPLVISVGAGDAHGPGYPIPYKDLGAHFHLQILQPLKETPRPARPEDGTRLLEACTSQMDAWWENSLVPTPPVKMELELPVLIDHGKWVFGDAGDEQVGRRVAGSAWLYDQGIDRFVMCSRLVGGRYRYTLGRRSDLIAGFPVAHLYEALNAAEAVIRGGALDAGCRWGGGSTIGGSPRDGSLLTPEAVTETIRKALEADGPRSWLGGTR